MTEQEQLACLRALVHDYQTLMRERLHGRTELLSWRASKLDARATALLADTQPTEPKSAVTGKEIYELWSTYAWQQDVIHPWEGLPDFYQQRYEAIASLLNVRYLTPAREGDTKE